MFLTYKEYVHRGLHTPYGILEKVTNTQRSSTMHKTKVVFEASVFSCQGHVYCSYQVLVVQLYYRSVNHCCNYCNSACMFKFLFSKMEVTES